MHAPGLAGLPGLQFLPIAFHFIVVEIEHTGVAPALAALVVAGTLWRQGFGVGGSRKRLVAGHGKCKEKRGPRQYMPLAQSGWGRATVRKGTRLNLIFTIQRA